LGANGWGEIGCRNWEIFGGPERNSNLGIGVRRTSEKVLRWGVKPCCQISKKRGGQGKSEVDAGLLLANLGGEKKIDLE